MEFQILIDDSFIDTCDTSSISPAENKNILSLINDYEDGKWRETKFDNFIWDNIAETALSFRERESLSSHAMTQLRESAKNLRLSDKEDNISKGSELAEILLYGIMKHHYSALPVVPKIFYKQNAQDNAKGADSVHIIINDDDFTIWFGEAKFYNKIEDARLTSIITSVKNSLQTDKLKKENAIITNLSDIDYFIDDEELNKKIKSALSNRNSIDSLKPKLHIPILLLHECEITKTASETNEQYIKSIIAYHKERATSYFKKQIDKLKDVYMYSEITFHLILFPVPEKELIVNRFVKEVESFKEK